ncbi:hypothetical protein MTCD1_01729 [Colwellia marinimaniae]|uniref:Uncharacterized protein n=1 Tax=Colwellia marinimaniae TaxID=1513592 RepID=A0ABQ0MUS6_9GAMM|nr:hypothetical protein MTCD1_01729 [Colwellia marinimaniae]
MLASGDIDLLINVAKTQAIELFSYHGYSIKLRLYSSIIEVKTDTR